ncbi:MAG: hypothetical protein WCL00_07000, partial [Bacteroidota bacterium]
FDKEEDIPVRSIVLFSGKEYIAQTKPAFEREDIIPFLKTEKARFCGFQFELPLNTLTGKKFRAFGVTGKGSAFELIMTVPAKESMIELFTNIRK